MISNNTFITAEAFGLPPLHDPTNQLLHNSRLINSKMIDAQVATVVAPLKHDPSIESETLTYVLHGEPLQVLGETGTWQLVVSVIDGYLGWLDQTHVRAIKNHPTHRVSAPMAHIYTKPDLKSSPVNMLPMGAFIACAGSSENQFMPLETGGWVYSKHINVIGRGTSNPISIAESFIGTPYLWGGRSRLGIDCSALVQVSLSASGHRVHRDSGPQFGSLGRALDETETPTRGDLAFFPGHVGWMLDSMHMLHANATHMAVTIDTVDEVTAWVAAQTEKPPFSGFKRLQAE